VVHQPDQLQLLADLRSTHRFVVWLKIDTGMNRLGFRVEQFAVALQRLQTLSERVREIRVLTHLARADEPADPMNSLQVQRFSALVQGLGLPLSIANSAALLANPQPTKLNPAIMLQGARAPKAAAVRSVAQAVSAMPPTCSARWSAPGSPGRSRASSQSR
jgi:alanine racemase